MASTLKDKVCAMNHLEFQRKVLKNVVPSKEFEKLFQKEPSSLTKEEKERLTKLILDNVGRDNVKSPITNADLVSFMAATIIRMATHK